MTEPSPPAPPLSSGASSPPPPASIPRYAILPRIRSSLQTDPRTEIAASSAFVDITTPLSPSVSSQPQRPVRAARDRGRGSETTASQPLTRLLSRLDAPERCRWSGLTVGLFYLITVLTWPSLLVSSMGVVCGAVGYVSCTKPYTVTKIVYVYAYLWLNAAMVGVLWWVILDQIILRDNKDNNNNSNNNIKGDNSVGDMYVSAFVLMGSVLHTRSMSASRELVRKCGLWTILLDAAWPHHWRRSLLSSRDPAQTVENPENQNEEDHGEPDVEPNGEPRPSLLSEQGRESTVMRSSLHSFEIDVVPWPPVAAASPSPVTSYRRIYDLSN